MLNNLFLSDKIKIFKASEIYFAKIENIKSHFINNNY